MLIDPRLLIVRTAVIKPEVNQFLDLVTLSREASKEFYNQFPEEDRDLTAMLKYVDENALTCLGREGVSLTARKRVEVEGNTYHLGDALTESKAFELGFHEPHIDTQCARIGQLAHAYVMKDGLEEALRSNGLINEDQSIVIRNGLHVVRKEQANRYARSSIRGLNNAQRPITLYVFDPVDGQVATGCSVYVESVNTIYEFMTSASVLK